MRRWRFWKGYRDIVIRTETHVSAATSLFFCRDKLVCKKGGRWQILENNFNIHNSRSTQYYRKDPVLFPHLPFFFVCLNFQPYDVTSRGRCHIDCPRWNDTQVRHKRQRYCSLIYSKHNGIYMCRARSFISKIIDFGSLTVFLIFNPLCITPWEVISFVDFMWSFKRYWSKICNDIEKSICLISSLLFSFKIKLLSSKIWSFYIIRIAS